MTKEMEQTLNFYYKDEAKQLRKLVDVICRKKFGNNLSTSLKQEFYSCANEIFAREICLRYDPKKGSLKDFIYATMERKLLSEMTRMNRIKRTPYMRDENGEIKKDENGKPIQMVVISFDESYDDSENLLRDILPDDYDLEKDVIGEDEEGKIEKYFAKLSLNQQKILHLLVEGYVKKEIVEILHMSPREYDDSMNGIRAFENIKILL